MTSNNAAQNTNNTGIGGSIIYWKLPMSLPLQEPVSAVWFDDVYTNILSARAEERL
jgi:hypothetical protein